VRCRTDMIREMCAEHAKRRSCVGCVGAGGQMD